MIGLLVVLSVCVFVVWQITSNWVIAAGLEGISVAACLITYFVKPELFENLLTKLFGKLALTDVFENIVSGSIVDVSGIVLYLSVIAVFVFLTVQAIQKRRWS